MVYLAQKEGDRIPYEYEHDFDDPRPELSDEDGAWLLHLTFADPTNAAAVAEDTVNCPHLVQLRSGRRLPGKARAENAKATTVSSVSYQRSTVSV